ncbi:putative Polysaccharide biosynthesis protein [Nitrospira lenta]|uniref:Putative Polysaccharide biosynthesis protein n=1 Tax=Nitrospira lenta TaxID=1436998 RepID=A0A330L8M0_9BACT|nr:oligosaccharide flippase family protein [Nitrospira lenta]SPP66206.1 putative Polysaccharide biosynthesis protein [Nitrospira lenta]
MIAIGSTTGQLMVVVSMPFITRLYGPGEMGLYAVFTASVGLFATVVAFHYELAIPLSKCDLHARLLTKLALLVAFVVGLLLLGVVIATGDSALKLLGTPELTSIEWLLPISLFATSLVTVLTYRAIRFKTFRLTAAGKALQGVVQSGAQIGYGLLGFGASGLIYGTIMGQCIAIYILGQSGFWQEITRGWSSHKSKFIVLAGRHKNFPMVSTPSSFINAAVAQLPTIALAAWFDIRVVGLYALGIRILQVPMRFIGDSLSQVFFSMAAEAHRNGSLENVVTKTWRVQTTFALHSFVPLAIIAPELFGTVFGQEWREAGVYTQLIMPWIMVSFISTSLSILVTVLQKQKQEFLFQLVYLSVLPGALWLGRAGASEHLAIGSLGIAASILLTCKIIWLLHIAGVNLAPQALWLSREVLYVTSVAVVLLIVKTLAGSELFTVLAAATLVLATHSVNYLLRKTYVF